MPKYMVHIPVTADVGVVVEADNEEEAIDKAYEIPWGMQITHADDNDVEICEMESHDHIVEGNVFSGVLNELYVEEL